MTNNTVQINQLLIEREELFAEVYHLEQQINNLLGQPYPFSMPADLPSAQKRKKTRAARKQAAPNTIRLRKLNPETETAYRISYLDQGIEKIEIHVDPRSLAILINTPLPHITVLKLETVHPLENETWESNETLFDAEYSPQKANQIPIS